MTAYKSLCKLQYEDLLYSQFLYTAVLYHRTPFRAVCFASEANSITIIIFTRTSSETVATRHLKVSKSGAESIIHRLKIDFGIEVEALEGDADESS